MIKFGLYQRANYKQEQGAKGKRFQELKSLIKGGKCEELSQSLGDFDINYIQEKYKSYSVETSFSDRTNSVGQNQTLLHIAIDSNQFEIVKFLHENGANLSQVYEAFQGDDYTSFPDGDGMFTTSMYTLAGGDGNRISNSSKTVMSPVEIAAIVAKKNDDWLIFDYLIKNGAKYEKEKLSEEAQARIPPPLGKKPGSALVKRELIFKEGAEGSSKVAKQAEAGGIHGLN